MTVVARLLPILVAAFGAFLVSGAYYGLLGTQLVRLSSAYADPRPSPAQTAAVELVRNLVIASVVAWLVANQDVTQLGAALLLAVALWVAFPLVLLAGSVFHERVPARLAALHAGDWLLKLILITAVTTIWS
jgi:Protein of unknown function (DUF1761)